MKRTDARDIAFNLIFEHDFKRENRMEDTISDAVEARDLVTEDYAVTTAESVFDHIAEIDGIIVKYSREWDIGRISRVSRAVLRLSVYEILYADDVPESAAINEAVELAKQYEGEEAGAFINGILGSFVRGRRE